MARDPNLRPWLPTALVMAWLSCVIAGCQTMSTALVPCPISTVEQATKIQEVARLGMNREQAIAALKQAGITGTFGTAQSIYYCDTWSQSDKEQWIINVQILFNEQGQVYAYRPDPKAIAAEPPGTATAAKKPKQVASAKQSGIVDPFSE
jgi:hypothetical protein